MSFDNIWSAAKADGSYPEKNEPPVGWSGLASIAEAKFQKIKDELTMIVEFASTDGKYHWNEWKTVKTPGQAMAAKILMKDLGLDPEAHTTPDSIHGALKTIEGAYYSVARQPSDRLKTDGTPFVNTKVLGRADSTVASQPPAVAAPTQAGGHTFPSAVAPEPSPMGAEFGDKAPWE